MDVAVARYLGMCPGALLGIQGTEVPRYCVCYTDQVCGRLVQRQSAVQCSAVRRMRVSCGNQGFSCFFWVEWERKEEAGGEIGKAYGVGDRERKRKKKKKIHTQSLLLVVFLPFFSCSKIPHSKSSAYIPGSEARMYCGLPAVVPVQATTTPHCPVARSDKTHFYLPPTPLRLLFSSYDDTSFRSRGSPALPKFS